MLLDVDFTSGRLLDAMYEFVICTDYVQGRFIHPTEALAEPRAWTTDPTLVMGLLNEHINKLSNERLGVWFATTPNGASFAGTTAGEAIVRAILAYTEAVEIDIPDELYEQFKCED